MLKLNALLIPLLLTMSFSAFAEKMDIETHSLVIEKLERALSQMSPTDSSRMGVQNRLGDLYAERARLLFMQESEKGCENCLGSYEDRKKALIAYSQVLEKTEGERQEKILLQIAHLNELNGQGKSAEKLYLGIVNQPKKYSSRLVAQAHTGLGEIAFREGKFAKALEHFEKALRIPDAPKAGYITYRKAWCYLNLGQSEKAVNTLISILESPDLLKKDSDSRIDKAFHADVSRDLATFLARGPIGRQEIKKLIDLSPDYAAKSNLHYLATEADRVGQKASALAVWKEYLNFETTPFDKLEVQVHVTQIQFDLGRTHRAVAELERTAEMWRKQGCNREEECEMLRLRYRQTVTEWHKAEKQKPTKNLLKAYATYNSLFTDDLEMQFWSAEVARQLSQWRQSIELYNKASRLAASQLREKKNNKETQKLFEASLLGQIEVAEITKNREFREQAYEHYLKMNPNGQKVLEVRYQRSQIYYERRQYRKAAEHFTAVALSSEPGQYDLKKKAADLALDALALEKDEALMKKWALEFAKQFPKAEQEYLRIARRAVINKTAQVAKGSASSTQDYKVALAEMSAAPLKGADKSEKVAYYRNKIILAEKAKDLKTVNSAAEEMLAIQGLEEKDREFALGRQVWVAEMTLNFALAYRISQKMEMPELKEEDKALRLGLLAELSLKDPRPHYSKYIKLTNSRYKANLIRARLVRLSRSPWLELDRQIKSLKSTPEILGGLAQEIFAQHRNYRRAKNIIKMPGLLRTPGAQSLQRIVFFRDFDSMNREISKHQIRKQSSYLVQRTLKQRLKLIAKAEALAAESVKTRDWTLQILTLDLLTRENNRLYNELLKLPVPANLNKKQAAQYSRLLVQQAAPFKKKADKYQTKLNDFWNNDRAVKSLITDYEKASAPVDRLVAEEMNYLKRIAPGSVAGRFVNAMNAKDKPSRHEILNARQDLKEDPFNERKAKKLRDLEENLGGEAMVTFLTARLEKAKNWSRQ